MYLLVKEKLKKRTCEHVCLPSVPNSNTPKCQTSDLGSLQCTILLLLSNTPILSPSLAQFWCSILFYLICIFLNLLFKAICIHHNINSIVFYLFFCAFPLITCIFHYWNAATVTYAAIIHLWTCQNSFIHSYVSGY